MRQELPPQGHSLELHTFEQPVTSAEREHELSERCWREPIVEFYGIVHRTRRRAAPAPRPAPLGGEP